MNNTVLLKCASQLQVLAFEEDLYSLIFFLILHRYVVPFKVFIKGVSQELKRINLFNILVIYGKVNFRIYFHSFGREKHTLGFINI